MEDNCILFMWSTNSFLPAAIDIMNRWQFKYKTMITWIKKNYGLGYWFRSKTEHCLFGIRGEVPALKMNLPNIIQTDYVLKHSEKPLEFYDYVAACASKMDHKLHKPIRVLELFARQKQRIYFGSEWVCIGNELSGNDIRQDLKALVA